jgi:hypothetical protein
MEKEALLCSRNLECCGGLAYLRLPALPLQLAVVGRNWSSKRDDILLRFSSFENFLRALKQSDCLV